MTQPLIQALRSALGEGFLREETVRDEVRVWVSRSAWQAAAAFLHDDRGFDHFIDLTAVDYIEREGDRFDVMFLVRSQSSSERISVWTRVPDGTALDTLTPHYAGANWAEREVWDMFGIRFEGHPDLRRILLYEQFEGFPLRKDYPIERAQPLVPYRDEDGLDKLAPFGPDMGQPFGRVNWAQKAAGGDQQVSPTLAFQRAQRRNLSDSEAAERLLAKVKASASGTAAEPKEGT